MRSLYNCLLIEDEKPAVEILKTYLKNYPEFELRGNFTNVFDAQDYLRKHQIDILFLDINLPGITGLEFIKGLKNSPLIIITSAYDEHAIEAYDLDVFDYLLKPYSLSRFNRSIIRLKKHFSSSDTKSNNREQILIKSGINMVKIPLEKIIYIESQREFLLFFVDGQAAIKTRMTIQEALDLLTIKDFTQIHRSFLVNLNHIKSINSNEVLIKTIKLPIGRSYKAAVNQVWQDL